MIMIPPHEHNNGRFNSSEDSTSYDDFEEVAESEQQTREERPEAAPVRRGLLTRVRDGMQSWRLHLVHRAIDQPLDDRIRQRVPDWIYTPWGLSVVILVSFAAIGLWAVVLYAVAF